MEPPANLSQLPDMAILDIFHQMSLYDLVRHRPANRRLRDLLNVERRAYRRELTLAIGIGSQEACRDSMLWHELQNDLALFPGGWYQMLHESFVGHYLDFEQDVRETITNALPNITSLNIMFNCRTPLDGLDNIVEIVHLIGFYMPNLATLRVWAYGPQFINGFRWNSLICNHLVPDLFEVVRQMVHLETLWLDLTEWRDPNLDLPQEHFVMDDPPPNVPINTLFQNAAATFPTLREFRYATMSSIANLWALSQQLATIQTLQRIHIDSGSQWCGDWSALQPHIAPRFQEISVGMRPFREIGDQVFGAEPIQILPNLAHFFGLFNALVRVKVQLSQDALDGPRFLVLFRALAQVPRLQELKVEIFQGPLFTPQEVQQILVDRPDPLNALQILVIYANFRAVTCEAISMWPLFGDPPEEAAHFAHVVVPNLMCFKMWVESMAVCNLCPNAVHCAINALNYHWLYTMGGTVFVQITIQWHEGENRELVVGDILGHNYRHRLHPQLLR